jgi:integrase
MITIKSVEALSAGDTIWDERLKGFGCRRQTNAASYVLKYRVNGRQQFLTLGQHGPLTPDTARKKAKRILGQVANGQDPQAEKAEAKSNAANTLGALVEDYLAYAEKKQRPRYFKETKRHLTKRWKALHSVSVFHLTRRQVSTRLREIEAKHGKAATYQARVALSTLFKWAVGEGYELTNPVAGTNKPKTSKPRKRVLTDAELAEIWAACGDDDYGRIVRLLMLTAQRRDEVGGMLRQEINNDLWTIPGERTKNHREHILPLSKTAKAIISTALRSTNRDFAFGNGPRKKGGKDRGYSGWSKSKAALDLRILEARQKLLGDKAKPLPNWRLHDLRRTADTVMCDRLGVFPHIVEAVLNHVSGHKKGVAGVYNLAQYLDPMRSALDRWSDHIANITRS